LLCFRAALLCSTLAILVVFLTAPVSVASASTADYLSFELARAIPSAASSQSTFALRFCSAASRPEASFPKADSCAFIGGRFPSMGLPFFAIFIISLALLS
jgi:hypothetical protein